MSKQIDAERILTLVNNWRAHLLPTWATERRVEIYANGGPPPTEDDTCESDIVPLGFAQTYMRKEVSVLLDPLLLEPGIIDAKLCTPAINKPDRTLTVETYLNAELNRIVKTRMSNTLINVAGRSTVTGRACVFRKSPNDWVFKCGRLIHPSNAGIDLLDSTFREWAFAEELTLRDLEGRMNSSSAGKYGWQKKGLETLKLWIMASEAEKIGKTSGSRSGWMEYYDPDIWLRTEIGDSAYAKPVDVFWFFRKNGKVTKDDPRYGGHEKVDLYCISRFGSEASIKSELRNGTNMKWMESSTTGKGKDYLKTLDEEYRRTNLVDEKDAREEANERLLFYLPDVFDSIEQCLIMNVDDAAISGEQNMMDVRGTGVTAMPKLAVLEGLMTEVTNGLAFSAGYHFNAAPGVGHEWLKQLERAGGLRSGQNLPQGVSLLEKNNAFAGFGQAMGFMRMLDNSIAADSASANQGTFGGSQQEFAAQAQAELGMKQAAVSRRLEGWLQFLGRLSEQVGRTLCKAQDKLKKEHPCYQDALRMKLVLQNRYGIHPDEWDEERWDYSSRRLAGAMTRQQSVTMNTMLIQVVGPIMPSAIPLFAREIVRATMGDTVAAQITNPSQEESSSQTARAQINVASAYVTGKVPEVMPMDDPILHSKIASETVEGRIKAAQAAGQTTQAEVVSVLAILGYAAAHINRLPEALAVPAMERVAEMGKAIQSIPQQQPTPEGAITERDAAAFQLKARAEDRHEKGQALKENSQQVKTLMEMRKLSNAEEMQTETQKSLAAQRAQTYTGIETSLNEQDAFDLPVA